MEPLPRIAQVCDSPVANLLFTKAKEEEIEELLLREVISPG
tara:strand:- start:12 stop:134 length:123 start_codon:yes stop_codon:yes gene_type:complete